MLHTKSGKAFTNLIFEIFRCNGMLLSTGDRLTEQLHLSSARWQVLGAVEQGSLPVAQIARNMGLARQSVQRTADILAKEGIIVYTPNPDHKRAQLVSLTPSGRLVMKKLGRGQILWANRITANTSAAEIEAAVKLIKKLRLRLAADTDQMQ